MHYSIDNKVKKAVSGKQLHFLDNEAIEGSLLDKDKVAISVEVIANSKKGQELFTKIYSKFKDESAIPQNKSYQIKNGNLVVKVYESDESVNLYESLSAKPQTYPEDCDSESDSESDIDPMHDENGVRIECITSDCDECGNVLRFYCESLEEVKDKSYLIFTRSDDETKYELSEVVFPIMSLRYFEVLTLIRFLDESSVSLTDIAMVAMEEGQKEEENDNLYAMLVEYGDDVSKVNALSKRDHLVDNEEKDASCLQNSDNASNGDSVLQYSKINLRNSIAMKDKKKMAETSPSTSVVETDSNIRNKEADHVEVDSDGLFSDTDIISDTAIISNTTKISISDGTESRLNSDNNELHTGQISLKSKIVANVEKDSTDNATTSFNNTLLSQSSIASDHLTSERFRPCVSGDPDNISKRNSVLKKKNFKSTPCRLSQHGYHTKKRKVDSKKAVRASNDQIVTSVPSPLAITENPSNDDVKFVFSSDNFKLGVAINGISFQGSSFKFSLSNKNCAPININVESIPIGSSLEDCCIDGLSSKSDNISF